MLPAVLCCMWEFQHKQQSCSPGCHKVVCWEQEFAIDLPMTSWKPPFPVNQGVGRDVLWVWMRKRQLCVCTFASALNWVWQMDDISVTETVTCCVSRSDKGVIYQNALFHWPLTRHVWPIWEYLCLVLCLSWSAEVGATWWSPWEGIIKILNTPLHLYSSQLNGQWNG